MIKDLQLIITGGTIDSEWDPLKEPDATIPHGRVTPRSKSGIAPYLKQYIKPDITIYENVVALIDSRDMTDEILDRVFQGIQNSKSNNIIVTHGTDTVAVTARRLQKLITKGGELCSKKIICLGAFFPLLCGSPSDAPFNLGFAIAAFANIAPGVYVAMNGQVFDPDHVEKDFEKARFMLK